jgi:DNA helicase-2/ATP-dependent DNA helicase PcrA
LFEAALEAARIPDLQTRAQAAFAAFARQVLELQELSHEGVSALLQRVVGVTRFDDELGTSRSEADQQNWGNVQELVSTAVEYEKRSALRDEPATLEGFLESTVLVSDADQVDPEAGSVMLMTLHAAKGLEFPVVFIVGLEKGLIPFERAPRREEIDEDLFMNSSVALEEERRLLFVGMTRACEELYLTQARRRLRQGSYLSSVPSDFLAEMPLEFGSSFEGELFGLENAAASPGLRRSSPGRDPARILDRSETRRGAPPLLTTAAALLAGRSGEPKRTPFEVGMQVRHPRMGLGRVLRVGESAYGTVTVEFDRGETVDFVTRGAWCPLQPVGTD